MEHVRAPGKTLTVQGRQRAYSVPNITMFSTCPEISDTEINNADEKGLVLQQSKESQK